MNYRVTPLKRCGAMMPVQQWLGVVVNAHDPKPLRWAGWTITTIVVLALLADATVNLTFPSTLATEMMRTGFPPSRSSDLGLIMLVCAIVYAIPRTAVLGAILTTGFLGGAICAHFRIGEVTALPEIVSLLLGIMTWAGLYFRDGKVRALLPFRS
jgi:hypothetical protein